MNVQGVAFSPTPHISKRALCAGTLNTRHLIFMRPSRQNIITRPLMWWWKEIIGFVQCVLMHQNEPWHIQPCTLQEISIPHSLFYFFFQKEKINFKVEWDLISHSEPALWYHLAFFLMFCIFWRMKKRLRRTGTVPKSAVKNLQGFYLLFGVLHLSPQRKEL